MKFQSLRRCTMCSNPAIPGYTLCKHHVLKLGYSLPSPPAVKRNTVWSKVFGALVMAFFLLTLVPPLVRFAFEQFLDR